MRLVILFVVCIILIYGCTWQFAKNNHRERYSADDKIFHVVQNNIAGTISVLRGNGSEPILVQNAMDGIRPYIHPIVAPDGKGILTEVHPQHHRHQTGLYWGLKLVNGRDYFMNGKSDYWKRLSAGILMEKGTMVKWQTVYDLIDEQGNTTLTEISSWSLREDKGKFILDLHWKGTAATDITFGKFYVGGLFLRMPWREDIPGEVINSVGQRNNQAEGKRANWADVGMQIEGRPDWGHIAILDHPTNKAFPTPWRVDGELGIGPSRQILGDWKLGKGKTEVMRYRMIIYTGNLDSTVIAVLWNEFAK